jgi:hypothetical protein
MHKGKISRGSHVICFGPTVRTFEGQLFLEAGFGRVLQNKREGVSRSAKRAVGHCDSHSSATEDG